MQDINIYGLANCDVTKLALSWLKKNNIPVVFHDYKKSGITIARLNEWSEKIPWEKLLNKRGTTWRNISPSLQQTINTREAANKLMQEHTSLIKRPVIEYNGRILAGFDEDEYSKLLKK